MLFFFAPFFFFLAIVVGTVMASLAVIGGPDPCEPGGGEIVISEANADAFQEKWDSFERTLDNGSPASVTFTESEISSRALRAAEGAVDDQDWLQDFRVCLHDGEGEISGTFNLPSFLDIKFKAGGTARIEDQLIVKVDSAELGSLPGFVGDWIDDADDTIDVLDEDDFEHSYELTLREGEAQIDGTP